MVLQKKKKKNKTKQKKVKLIVQTPLGRRHWHSVGYRTPVCCAWEWFTEVYKKKKKTKKKMNLSPSVLSHLQGNRKGNLFSFCYFTNLSHHFSKTVSIKGGVPCTYLPNSKTTTTTTTHLVLVVIQTDSFSYNEGKIRIYLLLCRQSPSAGSVYFILKNSLNSVVATLCKLHCQFYATPPPRSPPSSPPNTNMVRGVLFPHPPTSLHPSRAPRISSMNNTACSFAAGPFQRHTWPLSKGASPRVASPLHCATHRSCSDSTCCTMAARSADVSAEVARRPINGPLPYSALRGPDCIREMPLTSLLGWCVVVDA